jgi:hypothetical protein
MASEKLRMAGDTDANAISGGLPSGHVLVPGRIRLDRDAIGLPVYNRAWRKEMPWYDMLPGAVRIVSYDSRRQPV